MKKAIIIVALIALSAMATAQNAIYRQNLSKEINELNVSGDCTIILKLDTCNWIAYQGTENDLSQNFFTVAGNIIQTTAAANGKTISVGTSASRTNNSAPLVIDIKDNARVIFMGDTLRNGRHTRSFYSGAVENKKKGTRTEWGITISDQTDNDKPNTARNWTGLKKYTVSNRIHNQFYIGSGLWITNNANATDLTKGHFFGNEGWQFSYSLYMDDHVAAGIGIQWSQQQYTFIKPNVTINRSNGDLNLEYLSSDMPGTWESTIYTSSIDFPLHFTFYPSAQKHTFNIQLELIPQFNFARTLARTYKHIENDESVNTRYSKDIPLQLFQLKTRFSVNFGRIGAYAETGLTPLFRSINLPDGNPITPYHFAFGVRLNLF
ncbi:MAG: hypothetical protein IJM74_09840 [Bacteroidales bacterium]|nr:hypothetical protein [Bacteroidales bacterium]